MIPSFYVELKSMKSVMRWNSAPRIAKCHALVLRLPFPPTGYERNILKMHSGSGERSGGRKKSWGARREAQLCWPGGKSGMSLMLWQRRGIGNAEEMPGGTTWFTHISIFYAAKGWFYLKSTWKYSPLGFQLNLLLSPWEQLNMLLQHFLFTHINFFKDLLEHKYTLTTPE